MSPFFFFGNIVKPRRLPILCMGSLENKITIISHLPAIIISFSYVPEKLFSLSHANEKLFSFSHADEKLISFSYENEHYSSIYCNFPN